MNNQAETLWNIIVDKDYCNPAKRMDFVLFFDVRDGNPNGDPDAGNLPRMDPQTRQGIITDVCIKRKIRNYFSEVLERPIYIQSKDSLNTLYYKAARDIVNYESSVNSNSSESKNQQQKDKETVESLFIELDSKTNNGFKVLLSSNGANDVQFIDWLQNIQIEGLEFDPENGTLTYLGEANSKEKFRELFADKEYESEPWKAQIETLAKLLNDAKPKKSAKERDARDAIKRKMCEKYDDIRMFGAVLTAGTNAGQIRGPMQLTFGRSIEPILQQDAAITRCAITTSADFSKKQTEFGRKPWLNWAVYRQHGFFNPLLGVSTGIKKEDLARFWEALACMFRNSDSASKGEMTMHDIIIFVHDHPRGDAPSHLLFEGVKCDSTNNSGSFKHNLTIKRDGFDRFYNITVDTKSNETVRVYFPLNDLWSHKV